MWSVEVLFQMGSQSDEILVFNQDGTGWIERINYQEWSADFFEWTPTSPSWIVFAFTKHIETHKYTRKVIELPPSKTEHTSANIKVERTPAGKEQKVLHIQIFDGGHEVYGLVNGDPKTRMEPTGQTI